MMEISFTVYMDPVPKNHAKVYPTAHGIRGTQPQRVRTAEALIRHAAWEQGDSFPAGMAIKADIILCMSRPKKCQRVLPTIRPDWDNLGKLISDAMNKIVYDDDGQLTDVRVRKRYSEEPRVEVIMTEDQGGDHGTDGK